MDVCSTMRYSSSVAPVRIVSKHCIGPKVVFLLNGLAIEEHRTIQPLTLGHVY